VRQKPTYTLSLLHKGIYVTTGKLVADLRRWAQTRKGSGTMMQAVPRTKSDVAATLVTPICEQDAGAAAAEPPKDISCKKIPPLPF
jgi:hypothetical protein